MNITQPTLLLDQKKAIRNIDNMLTRAQRTNVRLRPHFKTHQSAAVGEWIREKGMEAITVSSVSMAQYFAQHGWQDITIAFPVNLLEVEAINELASQVQLNLTVVMEETIPFLEEHLSSKVGVFVKVDTGYHRTGLLAEDLPSITKLLERMKTSEKLQFKGFLAHTGHNYQSSGKEEILKNHKKTVLDLNELKDRFRKEWPQLEVSLGDTPACSITDEFYGIDEIRPGNFVFYDIMQYVLGSCSEEEIAVAMACPIVAKHDWRKEVVIYGGGVHFSKEYIEADDQGTKLFGSLVRLTENGWGEILGGGYLASLSQEHGIIKCNETLFEELKVGELIGILPIHSCMTANLMKQYLTTTGETIEMMR